MKRIVLRGTRVEARFLNARAETQKTKKRTAGNKLPCAKHKKTKVGAGAQIKTIRKRVFEELALNNHRDAFAAADAERCQAALGVCFPHCVNQCDEDACA